MRTRVKYSQNFLQNQSLVKSLVEKSSISRADIVYEIGAGQGVVTTELLKKAKRVVAFELDRNLFNKLQQRFKGEKRLKLILGNFLSGTLPESTYKVFSNIPFNLTSAIIKKLTLNDDSPEDAYLIVQKEAATRFAGKPMGGTNSQLAILLCPWFHLSLAYKFKRRDFFPRPNVDVVLLRITKKDASLVDPAQKAMYGDFVVFSFSQTEPNISEGLSGVLGKEAVEKVAKITGFNPKSKPSELNFEDWIELFRLFITIPKNKQDIVKGSFYKQLKRQENIEKVQRTRLDKNWKKYLNYQPH
ncbi:23S ribosomal RNA methyltransferase Erm [Candidatus Microgenomates bacterium]|nr:MAG: 23S ribosomal RNA methyltransferase Erm [Candidatus Microgenomates bacterium]